MYEKGDFKNILLMISKSNNVTIRDILEQCASTVSYQYMVRWGKTSR